jgi:hypothetical protein
MTNEDMPSSGGLTARDLASEELRPDPDDGCPAGHHDRVSGAGGHFTGRCTATTVCLHPEARDLRIGFAGTQLPWPARPWTS